MSKKKVYSWDELKTSSPDGVYKDADATSYDDSRLVVWGEYNEDRVVIYVNGDVIEPACTEAWRGVSFRKTKKTAAVSVILN